MEFNKIFVENGVRDSVYTKNILDAFGRGEITYLDDIGDVFGRVKKPYLQKRDNLNLFVGKRRGTLVKETPAAYGFSDAPHYYFIHAYNCIFECQYCYLQGYLNSPDLVLYVNHEEICDEIEKIILAANGKEIWFHAGEYSDSLALSGVTREWEIYWDLFKKYPNAKLEIRTKSVNIRPLLQLKAHENIIISFSMSPHKAVQTYDLKTPPLAGRIKAMAKIAAHGYPVGLHFDPIIYSEDFQEQYAELMVQVMEQIDDAHVYYVSVGVVRFTKEVYRAFKNNYPDSPLLGEELVGGQDQMVRYPRPMRLHILNTVKNIIGMGGIAPEKVYLCME